MQCDFHGGEVLRQMGEGRFYALGQLHGEIVPFLMGWLHTMLPISKDQFENGSFGEHQVKSTFSDFCLLLPQFTSYKDVWSFFFTRLSAGVWNRKVALSKATQHQWVTPSLSFEPYMPACLLIGYPYQAAIIEEIKRKRYEWT